MEKISRNGCIEKSQLKPRFHLQRQNRLLFYYNYVTLGRLIPLAQNNYFPFLCTTTTWKCLISRFMDKIVFPFLNLDMILRYSTEIIAIKIERTRIHFRSVCCHRILIACGRRRREGKGGKRERRLWDFLLLLQSPPPFFVPTSQARS